MMESLRLLPMCMSSTNFMFALVRSGVGKAEIDGGRRLFLGMDDDRWIGTSARCVVGAVAVAQGGGSPLSPWLRALVYCVSFAIG